MAKRKLSHSHRDKPVQKQEDIVRSHQETAPAVNSEGSGKLESLKTLNQILVKQAVEYREQMESLAHSKGSLEMELAHSNSERDALKSELGELGERAAGLELERSVVVAFVAAQMGLKREVIEREMKGSEMEVRKLKKVIDEKEGEIGRLNRRLSKIEGVLGDEKEVSRRVCVERDELKAKLDLQIEEGKGLGANLIELEERKVELEREIGELQVAYNGVFRQNEQKEMIIEAIMSEKGSVERSLAESNKLIEEMKEELQGALSEKDGIEEAKNVEVVKRQELENAVRGLNEMVTNLQKEEEKLRVNVVELEKKCVEGDERQKEMVREIDQLVEERKATEKNIQGLINERIAVEKDFKRALHQLAEQKHKIEEMVNEKIVMLEAKDRLDTEVFELQNQVAELKAVVLKLEESNSVEAEKIKSLESEVGDYRCKLEQVKVERDEMGICLDEEKQNVVRLKEKIGELENKIEESLTAIAEVKADNAAVFAEKVELENQCGLLMKKITSLEDTVTEAQNEFNSMKGKFELADATSELVLNMLKGTAGFCSRDETDVGEDDSLGDNQLNGEEMKPYVIELETIKNAFKKKETKVENMKRQLQLLQNSVEEAHKKKSLWTLLSSATTLLAAISLAYAARAH
ncbi:UNVERIFIED_CONTAM: hypothetical protein Sangu_1695200 [Sesamum angustifolium]|uniref:Uncharacterized protein n=1 Tax=Sesamum angustifolium TaxID=2727405 RepID=A0AAW2MM00_9LAMI